MMAMNTHRQLGMNNVAGQKSIEKLSSGFRINRAGDDAAGLAISEKMRGQIRGLNQASRNAQDGISLIQTAEGALNETHAILQRMRELAVQSSTDTNTDADRANLQDEINQLTAEITRIAETTEFNTMKLLDGSYADKKFHIGANEAQNITFDVNDMTAKALGVESAGLFTATVGSVEFQSTDANIKSVEVVSGAATGGAITHSLENGVLTITRAGDASGGDINAYLEAENVAVTVAGDVSVGTGNFEQKLYNIGAITDAQVNIADKDISALTFKAATGADDLRITKDQDGAVTVEVGTGVTFEALNAALKDYGIAITSETTPDTAVGEINSSGVEVSLDSSNTPIKIDTQAAADKAITTINNALETVSQERSKLGAFQNRLEHTIKNLDTSAENLQASEARIRDVDMAAEMMEFTKNNILQQASTAMLAQANMAPQSVLQLLR